LTNKFETKIVGFLKKRISSVIGIYIFGSYAANQVTAESDIDIAFLAEEKLTPVEKWKIQEKLATLLDLDVDLVDLKDASVVLKKEIVEKGILVFSANKFKVESFEMTTYSMYIDLNVTRKDILNDYRERYGRNPDK